MPGSVLLTSLVAPRPRRIAGDGLDDRAWIAVTLQGDQSRWLRGPDKRTGLQVANFMDAVSKRVFVLVAGAALLSGPVFFVAFAVLSLWYYQFVEVDLFMLTATLLGGIVVITAALARGFFASGGVEVTLLLALLVIAQSAGAAFWVRSVAER